jgi:hypothetical protein
VLTGFAQNDSAVTQVDHTCDPDLQWINLNRARVLLGDGEQLLVGLLDLNIERFEDDQDTLDMGGQTAWCGEKRRARRCWKGLGAASW